MKTPSVLLSPLAAFDGRGGILRFGAAVAWLAAGWLLSGAPALAQETSYLVHRYPFNETSGTVVEDVVGEADAEILGTGFFWDGVQLSLDGGPSNVAAYVDLPNGIISTFAGATGGSGGFSVEGWATVTGAQNWGRLFDFGSTISGEVFGPGGGGEGRDYLMVSGTNGTDPLNRRLEWRNEDPPGGGISTFDTPVSNFGFEFHFVLTFDESTGELVYYEDGFPLITGTTPLRLHQLNDVNNWLARSNWTGDATLQGAYNEFRIYDGALSPTQVEANFNAGPESPSGLEDTDGDGLPDGYENRYAFLDPGNPDDADLDEDGDGLTNKEEFDNQTRPDNTDSDGDGATDGDEVNLMMTDPRRVDTDGDGLADGVETGTGIFVDANDTGTDPLDVDSDSDGFEDGREVTEGTDPNDAGSFPSQPVMLHRWTFNEEAGFTIADSISGADGEIRGDGFLLDGGMLQLDGGSSEFAAYVDLPNGIISTLTNATIEGWVTVLGSQAWSRVFDFGSTQPGGLAGEITGPGDTNGGGTEGLDYFFLSAQVGGDTAQQQVEFREADPGPISTDLAPVAQPIPLGTEYQFAVVYDSTGSNGNPHIRLYQNGALLATVPTAKRLSQINDINNWLGRSNWNGDANLQGAYNEFRIYDAALSTSQVANSFAAGPDSPAGLADSDGDGLPDRYEDRFPGILDPNDGSDAAEDPDGDTLTNLQEFRRKTNPLSADSDGDGLSDAVETNTRVFVDADDTGTNPNSADTDSDTFSDADEIAAGTDPNEPYDFPAGTLIHRYDFNLAQGMTVPDLVGGADGEILGEGFSWTGTELRLDGGASTIAAYVDLPNGIISSLAAANGGTGALTIEGWATVEGSANAWGRLFDFGSSAGGEVFGPGGGGEGFDYLMVSAYNGTDPLNRRLEWRNEDPAGGGIFTLDTATDTFGLPFHFALTFDEASGHIRFYENGIQRLNGATVLNLDQLNDVNNWLGRSNWTGDGNLQGTYDEFRIYDGMLSRSQLEENFMLGPDFPPGGGPGLFQITAIAFDQTTNMVTLTFNSRPGSQYALEQTTSLQDGQWQEIDDGIVSQGTETVVTFAIPAPPDRPENLLFRFRELQL